MNVTCWLLVACVIHPVALAGVGARRVPPTGTLDLVWSG
jgi:hypothetical protein